MSHSFAPTPCPCYSFCTIYFWLFLELQIPFRFITFYIIWGNCGRLKNVLELGSVSPCLVSGLSLSDALIILSYLVGNVSYRHLYHPIFCLRTYFYPHLHLLTLKFFCLWARANFQCDLWIKLYVWDDIFIDTWKKRFTVSIKVGGNYENYLQQLTFRLKNRLLRVTGRRAAFAILILLIS